MGLLFPTNATTCASEDKELFKRVMDTFLSYELSVGAAPEVDG